MGEFAKKLRPAIREWHARPASVAATLNDQLHTGTTYSLLELQFAAKEVHAKAQQYETNIPQWTNTHGLLLMAHELSSSSFYSKLLESTSPTIRDGILMGAKTIDGGVAISANNASFMTATIYLSLLAALQGADVEYNLDFATRIAERFPTQAASPDEFMDRVRELVPNPDGPISGPTLIEYLKDHEVFRGHSGNVCPAIPLTGIILDQWGRQLASDGGYNARFRRMITLS